MKITDFQRTTLIDIGSFVDTICLIDFLSTCKQLWNLRRHPTFSRRIQDFKSSKSLGIREAIKRHREYDVIFLSKRFLHTHQQKMEDAHGDKQLQQQLREEVVETWHRSMCWAAEEGTRSLVDFFIDIGTSIGQDTYTTSWDDPMASAARGGHKDLVEFFILKGASNWDDALRSCLPPNKPLTPQVKELMEFFGSKGADWGSLLLGAMSHKDKNFLEFVLEKGPTFKQGTNLIEAAHNSPDFTLFLRLVSFFQTPPTLKFWNECLFWVPANREIAEYCVEKGANNWIQAMQQACTFGRKDLVEFYAEKWATFGFDWNEMLTHAVQSLNIDLVNYLIDKGANPNWSLPMGAAAIVGSMDLVQFFMDKGATDWNWGLKCAAEGGHRDIISMMIEKGANDWNSALMAAVEANNMELTKFFVEKGATNLVEVLKKSQFFEVRMYLKKQLQTSQ